MAAQCCKNMLLRMRLAGSLAVLLNISCHFFTFFNCKLPGIIYRSTICLHDIKIKDMNANDIDAAISMLAGTAISMGLDVIEG